MRLRPMTPADIALLEYWDTKPHVAAAGGDDDWFDWPVELAQDPPWREMLIAEVDGRPIGALQIIDAAEEETHYWGDIGPGFRAIDIWIGEEADLSRGFGSQMIRLAIERCFADPRTLAVLIDPLASNTRAHRFYERCGFKRVGPRTFGEDACIVYRMDRADWEGPRSGPRASTG
jgi:aminoglycoside 6'-N-acetyltransferase